MKHVTTIFGQLLYFLPRNQFDLFVGQHQSDKYAKRFTTWQQLLVLLYAQATKKESLRDIETGLRSHQQKWYHLGIDGVARSTISHANNRRNPAVFESLFYALLKECKKFSLQREFSFSNPLYSVDMSHIALSLSIFEWAHYTRVKGALRLHTLLDNRTLIPEFITLTDGKTRDLTQAKKDWKKWDLPRGSIIAMDKGYIQYSFFAELNENDIFFVTRIKKNSNHIISKEHPCGEKGILADQTILLNGDGKRSYCKPLRLVTYYDEEQQKKYEFLTNNFLLSAKTIADIYKERWQIELFFKWIKQNLKIKSFLGTSQNAVMTQVWVAMIYYLLLYYICSKTNSSASLLEFSRIINALLWSAFLWCQQLAFRIKECLYVKTEGVHS